MAILVVAHLGCGTAFGQDEELPPFRLTGLIPGGVRASATDSWGIFEFQLANRSPIERKARVLVFYDGHADAQYGREVLLPAMSTLSTWMLVGPAGEQKSEVARDVQVLLYDLTDGTQRLVLPPTEERVRSRKVLYRKREPLTGILIDEQSSEEPTLGRLPEPRPAAEDVVDMGRVFRRLCKLPDHVQLIRPGSLPPTPMAFDGLDHLILATGKIAEDPAGMLALRRWLESGGRLWILLDMVEPDVVAGLIGAAFDFQIVDRTSLTTVGPRDPSAAQGIVDLPKDYERPIEFVRVLLPINEKPRSTVDGWPTWLTRQVGRGRVVLTTLGARAWYRPASGGPPAQPLQDRLPIRMLPTNREPVPTAMMEEMVGELTRPPGDAVPAKALEPMLTGEIGYAIVSQRTAGVIFVAFLTAAVALGVGLWRLRRPELLGWIGPVAAIAVAGVFFGLGEASRRAAPPTTAVVQIARGIPGLNEASIHGQMAVYRPDSGTSDIGPRQGGHLDLDMSGLEGKARRLLTTDLDSWHWEGLQLPAGLRLASLRYTTPTPTPLVAVASFAPEGIEGRLQASPFENPADAVLAVPGGRNLAVSMRDDGGFRVRSQDILPAGRYLADAILTDVQQKRQEVYRAFLGSNGAGGLVADRPVLFAWARPIDMHFTHDVQSRTVGAALLVAPVELKSPGPGQRITIPAPFIPCRRVVRGGLASPTLEGHLGADMHVRFQLPQTVLPFQIERARLSCRVHAPSRRVALAARTGNELVELRAVGSPLDPIEADITQERLLHLDADGGLHFNVAIGESETQSQAGEEGEAGREKWRIEYLELEVSGRASTGESVK